MNHYHACVDIGGTKVAVSLADSQSQLTRKLYARQVQPTAKQGTHLALAEQIIGLIDVACNEQGINRQQIQSVGVSSCGPFIMNTGRLELAAPNICGGLAGKARGLPNDWMSAPLQAPLEAVFQHVRIENDAVAALEAERRWGALQGLNHCAYVTWSTGIGMGLCVDGHVLHGKNGNAGHAGHSFVSDLASGEAAALCGCGNNADLEGLVAGNAIGRRYAAQGFTDATTLFIANSLIESTASTLNASQIIDELCRVMGRALYNLIVTLDLERISLGGSVFWHNQAVLLPRLRAEIQGKLPSLTTGCDIVPAGLGLEVGDLAGLALL
jgi:glucokinase